MDDEQFPSGCRGVCSLSWVLCRVCFLVRAFLCALSCARRAGGVRGLLVACWGCAKKFALRGDSDREARKSSPCGVIRIGKREKVRPAWQKWSVFGVFELAGRVFSRFGLDGGVVGRTFSRFGQGGTMQVVLCVRAGPVVRVDCSLRVRSARKSSPCSAKMAGFRCFWACWASFFAVWPRWRCCWANFFAPGGHGGVVGRTFSRRDGTGALLGELFRAATTPAIPAISR